VRIALYTRVSTDQQTTDNQTFELRRYADARRWTVIKEYADIVSGTTTSRPQLDQMLGDARRRRFDAIIIWKLDRLGRSLAHLVTLAEELQQIGVALVSLGENIDGSTTTGRLLLGVMASLAQFEKERLIERVHLGLARAKRQGKVLGRPRQQQPTGATVADCTGLSVRVAARTLGVSRSTAQRLLAAARPKSPAQVA
jgi:DNA invertase Pin-like site-specific DNA recombinase